MTWLNLQKQVSVLFVDFYQTLTLTAELSFVGIKQRQTRRSMLPRATIVPGSNANTSWQTNRQRLDGKTNQIQTEKNKAAHSYSHVHLRNNYVI